MASTKIRSAQTEGISAGRRSLASSSGYARTDSLLDSMDYGGRDSVFGHSGASKGLGKLFSRGASILEESGRSTRSGVGLKERISSTLSKLSDGEF